MRGIDPALLFVALAGNAVGRIKVSILKGNKAIQRRKYLKILIWGGIFRYFRQVLRRPPLDYPLGDRLKKSWENPSKIGVRPCPHPRSAPSYMIFLIPSSLGLYYDKYYVEFGGRLWNVIEGFL
jgi:hypothetical protein